MSKERTQQDDVVSILAAREVADSIARQMLSLEVTSIEDTPPIDQLLSRYGIKLEATLFILDLLQNTDEQP